MAHKHSVYDSDTHFIIDGITRAVKNADATKTMLVQHDHNSERFTFEMPRYIDGHDMSTCNVVQVHYINIDNKNKEQYPGVYDAEDLQISPDGEDVVLCSWLISGKATQYVGNLSFVLRFACVAADGTIDYAWNTAMHSKVYITEGIYNGDAIAEEYADILAQWEARISELEQNGGGGGATVDEVLDAMPKITGLDLSDFENGSFAEIIDGVAYQHAVSFDAEGRPVKIDGIDITWGAG